ncbi:MAG: primosomal protein N', partial [Dehalococcoidia bacterium]
EFPFTFTSDQQFAWDLIKGSITGAADIKKPGLFLLHGVTGSGKTEVYLQALAEIVRLGKKGICMVPEISLTPQVIDRFIGRFPGRVALLHSRLSLGQQFDVWHGINRGEFDIVIGPRSAIFAPQPDLGLIIVDEEHEWAYKQSDTMPRYHARDVAVKLASLTRSTLVLGSATPSVESYFRARRGVYQLVELPERITPLGRTPLPEVTVVNMRTELKNGNRSIFSRLLKSCLTSVVDNHEQAILFINRRGQATFLECMNCGYVPGCNRCSVALTYHAAGKRLICHHCRRVYQVIKKCPVCSSEDIKYFGIGTETVEAECRKLFPTSRIIRFDSDTVVKAHDYEGKINSFRKHEADILVGTQIIAKGLNFPGVSLVGIVNADVSINLPDFRSGERIFQLLCQVAGRAGRGTFAGKAVIQTFNPDYYAIKFAARHDYAGFYESEMKYRRTFGYPPYNNMVRLVYSHTNEDKCKAEADRVSILIQEKIAARGIPGTKMIGPATAYINRLRGKFQMQVILLGRELQSILSDMPLPAGWFLDVDPVGVI